MTAHRCFACDESNPERIVTNTDEGWIFEFIDRFAGPRGRAHGGIAVGALTCPALQLAERDGMLNPVALRVTGRLKLPIPLAKPIRVTAYADENQYRVQMHEGSNVIMNGLVEVADKETEVGSTLQQPPPERVEDLKAFTEPAYTDIKGTTLFTQMRQIWEEAGLPWLGTKCFGCSEVEGALKLHHRVSRRGETWTHWEVEPAFTDGSGRLATTIIAAAIDCANLHSVTANDPEFVVRLFREKKIWMTGTYGVHFLRVPPVEIEDNYRVTARYLRQEENRLFSMSALLDREGTIYAMGESTAIIFDIPTELIEPKGR
jgi:hypothetical protein